MTTTKNDDGDTGDGNKYSNGQAVIVVNRLFVIFIPSAFHEGERWETWFFTVQTEKQEWLEVGGYKYVCFFR